MTQSIDHGKLVYWVMGVMFTIIMALMGLINTNFERRITVIEATGSPPLRERVSRLESERDAMIRELIALRDGQTRIEELLRRHVEK